MTLKRTQEHPLRVCHGAKRNFWHGGEDGRHYSPGKMSSHCGHWEINLRCPGCHREGIFVENYLGGKPVLCNGRIFLKPGRYSLADLVGAVDRETPVKDVA